MYLHLYHGRLDLEEDLDDWGSDGGQFEIDTMVCTYQTHLRVKPKGQDDFIELNFQDDCVYYDGVYYSDWSVSDTPLDIVVTKLDVNKTKSKEPC